MAPKAKSKTEKRASKSRSSSNRKSSIRTSSASGRNISNSSRLSSPAGRVHSSHVGAATEDAAARRLQKAVRQFLGRKRTLAQASRQEHGEKPAGIESAADRWTSLISTHAFDVNLQAAMPLKSVIFLDIDGVLNIRGGATADGSAERITSSTPFFILRRRCVENLVLLVQQTTARLVLSSTWRNDDALKRDLLEVLVAHGLSENVIVGQTPNIDFNRRPDEIRAWIDDHLDAGVQTWAVLDDMRLGESLQLEGHFVWVNPVIGLSEVDLATTTKILSSYKS